jgi:hypothetical protein
MAAAVCLALAAAGSAMAAERTVKERLSVYAPVELAVPWDLMDEGERAALVEIYRAAEVMDEIFLRQVWSGNVAMLKKVIASGDADLLRLFQINFGPWDRIDDNTPFIGNMPKPDGADFYPADMTKEEFTSWVAAHPQDKEAFESTFTVIRRGPQGGLVAVPYSIEYGELLLKAAQHLRNAADLTANESLATFLRSRADAFLSNDYFQSDMDWMDVKGNVIDVTIGPYEVYEDNLFNYKASFEAFVCIRDPEESKRLDGLKGYLTKLEMNLPIPDEHKNLARGSESPISVVDEVFTAGDTKAGVQTLAFNLPNDERVQEAKGSKKVMLRNIIHAKFDKILVPIAERVIAKEQLPRVTFDAYYNHILLHEFSHGLGPGRIVLADGTQTTAQKALKECHSALEEAKADIVGEHNIYYLIDDGFFGRGLESEAAVTFLAGFFRSVRFGAESAHGRANMIIFNYLKEKGVYAQDAATGLWSADEAKMRGAVKDLAAEILMIQALGDYEGAKKMIETYGTMGDDVRASLEKLGDVPVDIAPQFEIQKRFAAE